MKKYILLIVMVVLFSVSCSASGSLPDGGSIIDSSGGDTEFYLEQGDSFDWVGFVDSGGRTTSIDIGDGFVLVNGFDAWQQENKHRFEAELDNIQIVPVYDDYYLRGFFVVHDSSVNIKSGD